MKEDKELLLKDLYARLPYGVKILHTGWNSDGDTDFETVETFIGIDNEYIYTVQDKTDTKKKHCLSISNWKPYLRPMSSMSEEEEKELQKITNNTFYLGFKYIKNSNTPLDGEWHVPYNNFVTNALCNKLISWLDEKHFDHRTDEEGKTLIEKGLALEAPKDMYK